MTRSVLLILALSGSGCGLLAPQEPRKECQVPVRRGVAEDMIEASPDCRGYQLPDMGGEGDVR